jgi:hypothetical protein
MGRVVVHSAKIEGTLVRSLDVQLGALPRRTITRETALSWMRDSHSFLPSVQGRLLPALQLVEVEGDDGSSWFIRTDNAAEASDKLPF